MPKREQKPSKQPTTTQRSNSAPQEFKETTESIVVAFILAFVFRAFIVEAFVIPTGSMASTLYGRHGTLICDDCGWENAYGLNDPQSGRIPGLHGPGAKVRCQNCGHLNSNLEYHDAVYVAGRLKVRSNAEAGDRILVFKWPFDLGAGALGPQRWDVTVFKNPAKGDQNFIKRLVGRPGEVLEIIDGDVYTVPAGELSADTLEELDYRRHLKYLERTGQLRRVSDRRMLTRSLSQPALDELTAKLRIQRKTDAAQESLWFIVYDHDYLPREWDPGQPRWIPDPAAGPAWKVQGRRLVFDGADGGLATVRFDADPARTTLRRVPEYGPIVDYNAYNIGVPPIQWNPVSDLKLAAVVNPQDGDGYIEFVLVKRSDRFAARLHADGRATLLHWADDRAEAETLAETVVSPFDAKRPFEVAFQNVDYRVSLVIEGREVLATTPDQYAPDVRALREQQPPPAVAPWITAAGLNLELWHVSLYRDEYYTSPFIGNSGSVGSRRPGWGTTGNPILLREDEYFMLGDNSPASKDSRLWDEVGIHLQGRGENYQLGTVPRDQLIGRAFFVYWPSGIRPGWLPGRGEFFLERFVPNVGRMRWIR
jgi:signal peptidase I